MVARTLKRIEQRWVEMDFPDGAELEAIVSEEIGARLLSARLPIFERCVSLERLGEIIALPRSAAERRQSRRQFDRLDPFGGGRHAERVGEAEHGADDRHAVGIDHHPGDEAAVDLEHVDRQALEIGEARIAGAEIVHRDRRIERLSAH